MATPQLPRAAKDLVRVRILAGDSNRQIRRCLSDAGYTPPSTDAAFTRYRNEPGIKRAIAERCEHLRQQGLGDRSRRVLKLSAIAERLERRLIEGEGQFEDMDAGDHLEGNSLYLLDRLLVTYQQIGKEVGDDKVTLEIKNGDNALSTLRGFLKVKPDDGNTTRLGPCETYLELGTT